MEKIIDGVHQMTVEDLYVVPESEDVKKNIEKFRDMKLGFLTHFGASTQFGMIESWSLCDENHRNRWSQEEIDWTNDMSEFKQQYWNLNKSFNPGRLDPDRIANSISRLGFKYVLMPTKHHDGFCMWDTKYSDYRVTHSDCPFSSHKYADIFGSLITAFKKQGLVTGAYFSKPDWNCEDYWPSEYKNSSNVTSPVGYKIEENPQKWERFVQYTHNQMLEIVSNYNPIDIMWLDGGHVSASHNQDIRMDEIANKLRKVNPGLIICDRTVGGKYENYITPEQNIPDRYIDVPWESCITVSNTFGYRFNEQYKTPKQIAEIFVEVICKGGNLALNIAPQPNGVLPAEALFVLSDFGQWVKENEKAIYGTRPVAPYYTQNIGLVIDKSGQEHMFLKNIVKYPLLVPKYVHTTADIEIKKLSYKGQELNFEKIGKKWRIEMPENVIDSKEPLCYVFEIDR